MNVLAMTKELEDPTEEEIKEYLAGNLCRCSGFVGQTRSILKYLKYKKNENSQETVSYTHLDVYKRQEEGFVVTVHGKGSFIAKNNQGLLMEERKREIETELEKVIRKARISGLSEEEIRELFELIMEE